MAKFNPERCWDCRHRRPCPLQKKCAPRDSSWTWESPANDTSRPQPQPSSLLPSLHRDAFPSDRTEGDPLAIYTSRIDYSGEHSLNITRKGNDPTGVVFAPSWSILRPVLQGLMDAKKLADRDLLLESRQKEDRAWETYVHEYVHEMRNSYRLNRGIWNKVLSMDQVVLVCYCVNPARCHRTILAGLLVKCGAQYHGEVRLAA